MAVTKLVDLTKGERPNMAMIVGSIYFAAEFCNIKKAEMGVTIKVHQECVSCLD
jgi:hypothetical protein